MATKSIETILRLAKNPYYTLTAEEQALLDDYNNASESGKKKSSRKPQLKKHGNATVKETGKLSKHIDDPVVE